MNWKILSGTMKMSSENKKYSYGKQFIDDDDIQAVIDVLKSDWLTQGPTVVEFERTLSNKFNATYTSAVSNGTAGLHLIGLALGWSKEDVVITSPITFLASANCILYCGATPDFVDIDPESYTIDINKLEDKIKFYRSKGKNIKGVVAVDFAGHPCDWKALKYLADKYNFQLVNDNCHALGASYDGDTGYASAFADMVNLSFHPVKHITTGEGGAILTNNAALDEKVKILRTHGMTKNENLLEKNDGPWYYEMHTPGFNYRITDFQCALGISQLKKLDNFLSARRKIAHYYDTLFANDERFILPVSKSNVIHAYHLYPLQILFNKINCSKNELFLKMKMKNIFCQVHYIPVHLQPYYRKIFGFKDGDFPVAEQFYLNEISIPLYPSLEIEDVEYIVKTLKEAINHY
jgi:UDP-4-amino-4,6-dideoxy-N-acetyl-beta-L-altrosamine transaminase